MSSPSEYYQDLASLHGLVVPNILSGNEIHVTEPGFQLPVHYVASKSIDDRLVTLETNSRDQLGQATEFLRAVVLADYPRLNQRSEDVKLPKSVVPKLFADLIPAKLVAGSIKDYQLQAIPQAEIPDTILAHFDRNARRSQRTEMFFGTAHFLASAELHAGTTLGRVGRLARLAVLGRHDSDGRLLSLEPTPYLWSYLLAGTERGVIDAMRRSRGRAWWADRKGKIGAIRSGTMTGR